MFPLDIFVLRITVTEIKSVNTTNNQAPINWVSTIMFSITLLAAITIVPAYGYYVGYGAYEWIMFVLFLYFSGMAITAGYHRLWAHKTYDAHPVVKAWHSFWGAASVQNSILIWSSGHRRHHRYVDDRDHDPYSINRGFWFAHMGWMVRHYPSSDLDFSNAKDLQKDKIVMHQHNHYGWYVFVSTVALPMFLGWLNGDIWGTFLLAGVLRLVLNHHFTFFINSLCHMWGSRPYTDTNTARDNAILALFTYGEGYHNFHHYFQNDYRNGVQPWQFDPTKWLIFGLSKVGLTSNLRRTPDFKIREAMVKMQFAKAESKLSNKNSTSESWKELVEKEYLQFKQTLDEWTKLRGEWMQKQREQLNKTRDNLVAKFESFEVASRFKELEYSLRLQHERLKQLNRQFVAV
jgi:stearoyl-CoA desaturase (delta-9 desaturase)